MAAGSGTWSASHVGDKQVFKQVTQAFPPAPPIPSPSHQRPGLFLSSFLGVNIFTFLCSIFILLVFSFFVCYSACYYSFTAHVLSFILLIFIFTRLLSLSKPLFFFCSHSHLDTFLLCPNVSFYDVILTHSHLEDFTQSKRNTRTKFTSFVIHISVFHCRFFW